MEALKAMMAGHANASRLDPAYAERLDIMPNMRAALDALGERPDETAALNAISDGIETNSARIAALEDAINMIDSQIAGVTGKLGTVEAAVEQRVGPAPTNLYRDKEKLVVTMGHYGDSARGKAQGPENTKLTATFAFSCKADAFVGKVSVSDKPDIAGLDLLWLTAPGDASDRAFSNMVVGGKTLRDNHFDTGGGAKTQIDRDADFNLTELKAGRTMDISTSW